MNAGLRLVDSPAWDIVGWSLLHYLWIGAALGGAAWLLRRAVRPLSPPARYAVAVATFAALAVAPPLVAWRVATQSDGAASAGAAATGVALESPTSFGSAASTRIASDSALPATALAPLAPAGPQVETIDAFLARHGSSALSVAARWAPAVWLVGMPLTFALLATGLFGAERLRQRSAVLLDGPIVDTARRWTEALRIARTVAVGVSDRVVAPLVIGVARPMIVLPAAIVARQSPEQMEMILLHELAHVRRADNLVNLAQRVVEAVLFFQPAVWFVSRWVRLEREHCCDNLVLSYTGDPQGYAETLASLAMPGISPAYAAAAMANHQLVSRIQHILSREEQAMSLSPKVAAIAGAICLVVGLSLSGAAQQAPGEERLSAVGNTTASSQDESAAKASDAGSGRTLAIDGSVGDAAFYVGEYVTAGDEGLKAAANVASGDAASTGLTVGSDATVDATLAQNSDGGATGVTSVIGYRNLAADTTASGMRPWGPEQATGAPDVPNAGDDERAWAALTQDDQDEWLELTYAEPVEVIAVQIFANHCPGAVSRVTVFDANTAGLQYTWQGEDPVKASGPRALGVSIVTIPASITTKRIRVELASKTVVGWNEIDAVGLLAANGKTHWATGATASSTYAERSAALHVIENGNGYLLYRSAVGEFTAAQDWAVSAGDSGRIGMRLRRRSPDVRDWSPDQATGAPADLSVADVDDRRHAWRPAKPDGGRETLHVFYAEPVKAKLLLVYELGAPGVVDIACRDTRDAEVRVLSGRNAATATAGVLSLPLDGKVAVSSVVLGLDTAATPGWTDIDAVGLIDDAGKVHWADRAQATSTRADVAGRAADGKARSPKWIEGHRRETKQESCTACHQDSAKDGPYRLKWIEDHRRATKNESCTSCHSDARAGDDAEGEMAARRSASVADLLAKNDRELREWLVQQGAANVRIGTNGDVAVESAASGETGDADPAGREPAGAAPNTALKAVEATRVFPLVGPAVVVERGEGLARVAVDKLDPTSLDRVPDHAPDHATAKRIDYYRRALEAQTSAAADARQAEGKELVRMALPVGERGYLSRSGRKIVRAERVEVPGTKNVVAITITGDGLELVGSEPGEGMLRCWEQNGEMLEISVKVLAKPLPSDASGRKPVPAEERTPPPEKSPDPRKASQADAATTIDRLALDYVDRGAVVGNSAATREQVARRAYLDLLGVPPTDEQIRRFVGDGSEAALVRSLRGLAAEATDTGGERQQ